MVNRVHLGHQVLREVQVELEVQDLQGPWVRQGRLGQMEPLANLELQVTPVPLEIGVKQVMLGFLAHLDPMDSQDLQDLQVLRDPRGPLETLVHLANQVVLGQSALRANEVTQAHKEIQAQLEDQGLLGLRGQEEMLDQLEPQDLWAPLVQLVQLVTKD